MTEVSPIRMTRALDRPLPSPPLPAGIALRTLAALDVPRVHTLMALCYRNGFGSVPDYETWWAATRRDAEYDRNLCFVAVDETDRVVGFALVWNSGFIKDLVVHPDVQGRGLGSALLGAIFAALAARGHAGVSLKVSVGNADAQSLYRRMGFAADQ